MEFDDYRKVTQSEIAKIFRTNAVTVSRWADAGAPFVKQGRRKTMDPADIHVWLSDREVAKQAKKSPKISEDDMSFDDNLDKQRYYTAERAKLALERERGKLISKEDHDDFVRQAGDFVRQGFQMMPKKLAVKLAKTKDSNEVEKILNEEIINTLKRLSEVEVEISDESVDDV